MANVSQKFIATVKLHKTPAYQIAQKAGISPVTLSKLMRGITPPQKNDSRIIAIGELLGLTSDECFEAQKETSHE